MLQEKPPPRELEGFRQHPGAGPGWMRKLVEGDDLYAIEYAARHCSERYNIRVLSQRADELRRELAAR